METMIGTSLMNPEQYEIYVVRVPFKEGDGSKTRPALLLKSFGKAVAVFSVTTQFNLKKPTHKNTYFPIKNWREAGLKKPSYVETKRFLFVDTKAISGTKAIGKLTPIDARNLRQFIKQNIQYLEYSTNRITDLLKQSSNKSNRSKLSNQNNRKGLSR